MTSRQMRDSKGLQNGRCPRRPLGSWKVWQAVLHVVFDSQMRKQREALQHVSHSAFRDRMIDALRGIEQNAASDGDAPRVRSGQSGDAVEQSRFPGSGRPKQNGESGRGSERYIENELLGLGREALAKLSIEYRPVRFGMRGRRWRSCNRHGFVGALPTHG